MNGSAQCQRCKSEVDLTELRSGLCRACWDEIKARNAGKPKPRGAAKARQAETTRPADDQVLSLLAAGIKVSGTENVPSVSDPVKSTIETGNIVPGTTSQSYDIDNKPTSGDGHKVPGTAFDWQSRMAEDLALALRRIKVLEEQVQKLAPLIEKEEAKRDHEGMQKLRDDLFKLLVDSHNGGMYVSSLHGHHGQRGGRLGISKTQAFRLRDACRLDDRFKVQRTENRSSKWIIILNQTIK